jgi:hypothetical protein
MSRGRLPPDPRPLVCTGCVELPRFRDGVAVACVCSAPPHPRAHLNLIPMSTPLTRVEYTRE